MFIDRRSARFLADLIRRRSETRNAKITASLGDGLYDVVDLVTREGYRARLGVATAPRVGQVVRVNVDATGRSYGTEPLIIAVSQSVDNGAIGSDGVGSITLTAPTITVMPRYPVPLARGGPAVLLDLYGVGMTSAVVAYGSEAIVDDVPQVASGVRLTFAPRATNVCVPGRYSLSITGVRGRTIPDFFDVT